LDKAQSAPAQAVGNPAATCRKADLKEAEVAAAAAECRFQWAAAVKEAAADSKAICLSLRKADNRAKAKADSKAANLQCPAARAKAA